MRALTSAHLWDGEVVWSWHLDADATLAMRQLNADNGDKKPDLRGEREGHR